jgi:hypothetical protein
VVGYKDASAHADGVTKAINVLASVCKVDKEIGGNASQYAALCEYSHPNHMRVAVPSKHLIKSHEVA